MDRFLHAERFRKGKVQVKLTDIDLKSLLRDVATQFSRSAQEKRLELKVEIERPDAGGRVRPRADHRRIQNLLNNAIKYSTRGTVRVGVRAGPRPRPVRRPDLGDRPRPRDRRDKLPIFDAYTRGQTTASPAWAWAYDRRPGRRADPPACPPTPKSATGRPSTWTCLRTRHRPPRAAKTVACDPRIIPARTPGSWRGAPCHNHHPVSSLLGVSAFGVHFHLGHPRGIAKAVHRRGGCGGYRPGYNFGRHREVRAAAPHPRVP